MPLDAGIYSQVGRGVRSIADYDAEAQQAQANKLSLLLHQAQFQDYNRKLADDNALRQVVAGFGGDDAANINALYKAGRLPEAQGYQKSMLEAQAKRADIAKTGVETDKARTETSAKALESSIKAHDFHVQQLGALAGPQDISAWVDQGVKSGVFTPEQGAAGLAKAQQLAAQPGGFDQWRKMALQGGMSATQQLSQQLQEATQRETGRHNRSTEGNQAATLAETQRTHRVNEGIAGGHLAVSRANLDLSRQTAGAALTKPFEVTGPDGVPMLVQQDKQGNISPVQGYGPKSGSSKPMTEGQAKALGYGSRMQESNKILADLEGKYSPAGINTKMSAEGLPLVGGVTGYLANKSLSDESQMAEQAQRDFVNAILRRESGAAISPSEFDNARKQYFPEPGDAAAKLAQKAKNRDTAIRGVLAEVPTGQRNSISTPSASSAGGFSDADKEARYQAWKKANGK